MGPEVSTSPACRPGADGAVRVVPELSPGSGLGSGGPAAAPATLHVAVLHVGRHTVRKWVLGGLVLLLVLCAGGVAALVYFFVRPPLDVRADFEHPLKVPPLAASTVDAQGRRVFDLRAEPGDSDFGHGATR